MKSLQTGESRLQTAGQEGIAPQPALTTKPLTQQRERR